ncbi:XRE family transcriptional regulator [Catenulispora pinisilvae]|uniref:XRE family transcriptional regulator n=1 Tax=Catenulispora pinisilvae TaxID=2705253 RepID=UPI001891AE1B|nr:XRE family transcriptional regulator [Catenulispora pinisilvae]
MGRLEKQLDPQGGPEARLAVDLRELRRLAGAPTYREMSKAAGYSPSALSAAASGAGLPSVGVLTGYVRACGGDVEAWCRRRAEVALVVTAPVIAVTEPAAAAEVSEPVATARVRRRKLSFGRRAGGLLAAAIVGSLATVMPMAIWGAPSCMTSDHGQPVPAANCHQLSAH